MQAATRKITIFYVLQTSLQIYITLSDPGGRANVIPGRCFWLKSETSYNIRYTLKVKIILRKCFNGNVKFMDVTQKIYWQTNSFTLVLLSVKKTRCCHKLDNGTYVYTGIRKYTVQTQNTKYQYNQILIKFLNIWITF